MVQTYFERLAAAARERQFDLFKTWAHRYAAELWITLEDRYLMLGERLASRLEMHDLTEAHAVQWVST